MVLSNTRLEEIKKVVVALLKKYRMSHIPLSGFEIAEKMGIIVIPYSKYKQNAHIYELLQKNSEDGFFVGLQNGETYIYYNNCFGRTKQRQNYTIVHEIGHIVLGHAKGDEKEEMEANFFAKYLLAPPPLIHQLELKSAIEIAISFDISEQASEYAWEYYQKWLAYGAIEFTGYEFDLIGLFDKAIKGRLIG